MHSIFRTTLQQQETNMANYKLLINGELVDGASTMEVINPATETVLALCPRADEAQMEAAIQAAKAAFPAWSRRPIAQRRDLLLKLADTMDAQQEDLARVLTQEQGKPLGEATTEVLWTALFIRGIASQELPVKILEDSETMRVEQHRLPLGVVGAIIPWNFPLLLMAFKLPAALLAGNTIIIKPAPTTPLATLKIGEIMAGTFPAGVVNVVTDQNDLGGYLTLELGGNDAAIVLPGADPASVAQGIFNGAFLNAGQVCIAVKRAYVHESIYDDVVDRLAALAKQVVVGNGLDQGTTMGPIQNRMQYAKLKEFLEIARKDGRIVAGGEAEGQAGFFIRPTIVADIKNSSRLVQEEQFGPVLPVIKYSDPEEALTSANDSPWGLGGSVWGADREKAREIALRMYSGTTWINKHLDIGPAIPVCGAKQSGMGGELAEEGLLEFTQLHIINEAR